jgi:hypothetical protein
MALATAAGTLVGMWYTQWGDRTLDGAEGELFRAGLASLVATLDCCEKHGIPWETGVFVFDTLTPAAKLAILNLVGDALLQRHVPSPMLTAVTEGAAAAVYEHIRLMVEEEVDTSETMWRERIAAAYVEVGGARRMPVTTIATFERWSLRIECLEERIFWDCDWDHAEAFLDLHPTVANFTRSVTGILDEYYTAIAPDPTPEQLRQIRSSLRRLIAPRPAGRKRNNLS